MVDSGWLAPRSQRADVAARVETLVHPGAGPPSSQGERHNQALLAHRRALHAMIRDAALTTRSQQYNAA